MKAQAAEYPVEMIAQSHTQKRLAEIKDEIAASGMQVEEALKARRMAMADLRAAEKRLSKAHKELAQFAVWHLDYIKVTK